MTALDAIGSLALTLAVLGLMWQVASLDKRLWRVEHCYCRPEDDNCACGGQDCIMGGPE